MYVGYRIRQKMDIMKELVERIKDKRFKWMHWFGRLNTG